jgi:hypothetical protein
LVWSIYEVGISYSGRTYLEGKKIKGETGYKAFKASVMKSIQIEEHRFGVEPEIVAKLARTAVSRQQQRDVARRAAGLPARENRAQLFRHARAAVPALVRLMLALARAPASATRAD